VPRLGESGRNTTVSDAGHLFANDNTLYPSNYYHNTVTGALSRKTDSKIATTPKTQTKSTDQNKDKDNSK